MAGRDGVAAFHTRAGVDCRLLTSERRFPVDYDNGVQLANLLVVAAGDQVHVDTWWTRLPDDAHGVSVQVFDAAGLKVAGGDLVIHHESLARHRLDLSALKPGDYVLRLILYDAETGKSVSGLIVESGSRFQRELEIGAIAIE